MELPLPHCKWGYVILSETGSKSVEWRYLLGTLPPDEETRVEEGFIAHDLNFEQLELAEDELIDAYVRNKLSRGERRQFETKLLTSPRIAERVSFARALAQKLGARSQQDSSVGATVLDNPKVKWWESLFSRQLVFPTALAACAVLLLIGGAFLLFSWLQIRGESDRLASERTTLQKQHEETAKSLREQQTSNEQLAADLQRQRELLAEQRRQLDAAQNAGNQSNTRGLSGTIVSMMLLPGSLRDPSSQQPLTLASGVSHVQLNLVLGDNDFRSYQVTVTDRGGRTVVTRSGLTARKARAGHLIGLSVPATLLEPGSNYVVTIKGRSPNGTLTDVEDYVFRVSK